jgi:hypothetical protein
LKKVSFVLLIGRRHVFVQSKRTKVVSTTKKHISCSCRISFEYFFSLVRNFFSWKIQFSFQEGGQLKNEEVTGLLFIY